MTRLPVNPAIARFASAGAGFVLRPGIASIALACLALMAPALAKAQLVDRYFPSGVLGVGAPPGVTVASRARPEYDPPGIRLGSFIIRPNLSEGFGYDSAANGLEPARSSGLIQTTASVLAASDWSRNNMSAYLKLDSLSYPELASQSHADLSASLGKDIDLAPGRLTFSVSHLALNQTARDLNTPALDHPGQYSIDNARIGFDTLDGFVVLQPSLQFSAYRYDNVVAAGVPTNQTYRNRDILEGATTVRFGNELLRDFVVVLRGDSIHYVSPTPGQPSRNATAVSALAGLDYATGAIWHYRALVGYQLRSFASHAYRTETAPIAEVNVIYAPTGMTTVTATASRLIEDAAAEDVASYTLLEGRLTVDHELLRNLLLSAYGDIQRGDTAQGGGHETALSFGLSATWLMNRNMRMALSLDHTEKHSTTSSNLNENIILLRLIYGL